MGKEHFTHASAFYENNRPVKGAGYLQKEKEYEI